MLIVIVGKDYEGRARLREEASRGMSLAVVESSDTLVQDLLEKSEGTSLFGGVQAYLLRGLLSSEEGVDAILGDLAKSSNLFVFEEESLLKDKKDEVKDAGGEVREAKSAASGLPEFNLFALADALGKRDRKGLWILLARAIRGGFEPEEIAGVLHWQARSMLAAAQAKSVAETGMKEFTYAKAKRQSANFKPQELTALSRTLISLYHDGHRGDDMGLLLEKFALNL